MSDPATAAVTVPGTVAHLWAGWLLPGIIVACGLAAGWIADRIAMARLRAMAARTQGSWDDIVFGALRGVALVWCLLVSVMIALRNAPIDAANRELVGNALTVAWIASFSLVLARLTGATVRHLMDRNGLHGTATIAAITAQGLILALGFLIALQTIGIQVMPILGALGVGGLAVALALQDTLANLFAGLHILASRRIRPGDHVRTDSGEEGTIDEITWRYTTLRTIAGNLVVIPNGKLSAAAVTNYSLPEVELLATVPVEVAYGSDLDAVERAVVETARESLTGLLGLGEPQARFAAFNESGILVNCLLPLRTWTDQNLARHRFIKALSARFARDGIGIPYPTRTLIHAR